MRWIVLLLVTIIFCGGCSRTQPVYNVTDQTIPLTGYAFDKSEVKTLIVSAGNARGWSMREVAPGKLEGVLDVRRHHAKIIIEYDQEKFSIVYQDSQELLYDDGEIHKKYNAWIKNLEKDIIRAANIRSHQG